MTAAAVCMVWRRDYDKHWSGRGAVDEPKPAPWSGVERRVGPADRRRAQHDRRWHAERGRRERIADRRRR